MDVWEQVGADAPLITVIVPAFNAEATLAETLDSISRQTYRHLEILIVDDGSTDATAAIAKQFCGRDERARLLQKQNGGVASARNRGIGEARGAYLAPIDADDLWHPDYLLCALEKLVSSRSGMVFSWYRTIDMSAKVIRSGPRPEVEGRALNRMAYFNLVGNGSGMLIDRAVAMAFGGYDDRLHAAGVEGCEDYLIQLRIAAAYPIACVPRFHVGYRSRSNSMSSDAERMCRSNWEAISLFRESGAGFDLPQSLWQWSRARDMMRLARYRLLRGGIYGAVHSLLTAMRLDATGTLAAILYDVQRVTARLWRGQPKPPEIHFFAADPLESIGAPRFGNPDKPFMLERLERARMLHVAHLDESRASRPCTAQPVVLADLQ